MSLGLSKSYTPTSGQIANSTNYNTDISALFNAFSGLEAQTSTLGALTITPSANSTTIFKVTNAAATEIVSVDTTNSAFKILATGKIYLDGGGNTYIHEASSDNAEIVVGGAISMTFLASNDAALEATGKLYFDGGTETYMMESAADVFDIYVGGANIIKVTESTSDKVEINASDLEIDATQKFYLDGGGDTYLSESSANTVLLKVGNTDIMYAGTNGFGITTTKKFYLDGDVASGNTYITEQSADVVNMTVGGATVMYAGANGFGINSAKKFYLDGDVASGDTYITEGSANTISLVVGGVTTLASVATSMVLPLGVRIGSDAANNNIDDASGGSGSTTLYIGNAAITVASDKRLKENIKNTALDATNIVNNLRVVDFSWNDPSDRCENNRNSRGLWTGLIAQETIDILPFVVNAEDKNCPKCKSGEPCEEHKTHWRVEYQNIVPILIKALQEQNARIKLLESK